MGRLTLHGTNRKRFATCSWNEEFSLALSTDGASKGGSLEWTQFAPYSGGRATEISAHRRRALGPCQWFSLRGVSKTISPAPIRRMADSGNRPLGFHVRFGSKADMCAAKCRVRFTPESGHVRCNSACPLCANSRHTPSHSITSSARASSAGEIVRPSALAALRLMARSNLVGWTTGRSAGLAPLRMRPT